MTERIHIQEKVPEFFRTMWTGTIDAVSRMEKDAEGFVGKMVDRGKLTEEEGKKLVGELVERISDAREKIEKRAGDGLEKTWLRFNLPTKNEVDGLGSRVAKLKRQVSKLKKEVAKAS
jgi:polyhydroxyalkanoate synthesis regulator phasin